MLGAMCEFFLSLPGPRIVAILLEIVDKSVVCISWVDASRLRCFIMVFWLMAGIKEALWFGEDSI
jgi:hypothetical protein